MRKKRSSPIIAELPICLFGWRLASAANDKATLWMANGNLTPMRSTKSGDPLTWALMSRVMGDEKAFAYTPTEIWQVGDPTGYGVNAAYSYNTGATWITKPLVTNNYTPTITSIAPARTPLVE